ncbi:MAG TPA: alpha/beta hydrolase family protein [Capsulimonadaceae bacterium]|jgi:hypothetical protein
MSETVPGSFSPASWIASQVPPVPHLSFSNVTDRAPESVAAWQAAVRTRFAAILGGFPPTPSPLHARSLAEPVIVGGAYRREEIAFESREGLPVFAYFLTPLSGPGPFPCMVCFHGHGYGVNAVVGLDEAGAPLPEPDYHHSFAVQAVERGYAVLAIEILGFGRRIWGTNCQIPSGAALMLGQTMAGWRAYDGMRAIDYALTRPEVDGNRIAAMGISGGGLNTLFLAALDERIKAAMVSGFLNEFSSSVMSIDHCIDNFMPGLRLDLEMSDIAGAVAPRGLWCENGERDPIFPVAAFRRAIDETAKVYDALGCPERLHGHVFDDEHRFDGVGCWEFLAGLV